MNIFQDLMLSAKDLQLKSTRPPSVWLNTTKQFFIIKEESFWSCKLNTDVLPPEIKEVAVEMESKGYVTFDQATHKIKSFFKNHIPEFEQQIQYGFKRENISIYSIASPVYPIHDLGTISGRAGEWRFGFGAHLSLLRKNIWVTLQDHFPIQGNTRKEVIELFLYATAQNLLELYDEQLYIETNNKLEKKLIIPPEGWWITLIKPEVDLTNILN